MAHIRTNILVIDDDAEIRIIVRKILEGAGYGFFEADGVESGLVAAQKNAPHLILLDLILMDSDGFTFLDRKREIPSIQSTPVIVLSGKKDVQAVYKAVSLGASSYLVKPFTSLSLLQKIRKALLERSSSHLSYVFPIKRKISLQTNAVLTKMSQEYVCIELPIKLNTMEAVQIDSPLFRKVNFSTGTFKVAVPPRMPLSGGQYEIKLKYIGIREAVVEKISQLVRFWK